MALPIMHLYAVWGQPQPDLAALIQQSLLLPEQRFVQHASQRFSIDLAGISHGQNI
jgi:hypothetical protein